VSRVTTHEVNDPRLRFSYLLDSRLAGSHTYARHGARRQIPCPVYSLHN